jgi:hypothetical protein
MWRTFGGLILVLFIMAGCQTNDIEEVINKHGDFENIEGLNTFVDNVDNKIEDKINYVEFGEEGQRGVRTLTFEGEQINVSHSVDGKFVEEYKCKDIVLETNLHEKKYTMKQCTGDLNGDTELLSVPK